MKSNNPSYSLPHRCISPTFQKQTICRFNLYFFLIVTFRNLHKMYFTLPSFQFWVVLILVILAGYAILNLKWFSLLFLSLSLYLPDCYRELWCKSDFFFLQVNSCPPASKLLWSSFIICALTYYNVIILVFLYPFTL